MKKVLFFILAIALCTTSVFASDESIYRSLPSNYIQLEYISSSGTQFINTGFFPDENSKMFLDFYPTIKQSKCFAGSRNADSAGFFTIGSGSGNKLQFGALGNSRNVELGTHTIGRHTVSIEKGLFTYDGVETVVSESKIGTLDAKYSVYLFACNTNGPILQSSCRIYSCKIWDNGNLVRDFVPCFDKVNNTVGMYDLVFNKFYSNSGTGVFSVGPDVINPDPESPDLPDIPDVPDLPDDPVDSMNTKDAFFAMMSGIVSCMQIPMTIWEFTFSLWDVFMFSMVSAVIFGFIGKLFNM